MKRALAILLLFISISIDSGAQEQGEYQNHPLLKSSQIKNFVLNPGISECSFQLTDKSKWAMAISVPPLEEGKRYPLVLALHWAAKIDDHKEYSKCLAFPAFAPLNAIVVAPSSSQSYWFETINERRIVDLIKQIRKHWPIDENKVIVTGYSDGGIGAWHYAREFPKLFSAAIAVSGHYRSAELKIPVYIIHGKEDELFLESEVKGAIDESKRKGSKIEYLSLEGYGHYQACSYMEVLRRTAIEVDQELSK